MYLGNRWKVYAFALLSSLLLAARATAAPPAAQVTPVDVPNTTALGATTLDLKRADYVEEEFYISGTANRYRIVDVMGTAQLIDGGFPYKSRILVRRPKHAHDFNGTVVVEWYNVTAGQDIDF